MVKLLIFILLFASQTFAIKYDSLFIDSIKKFSDQEFGIKFNATLFTRWAKTSKPLTYIFASLPNRVEKPSDFYSSYLFISSNLNQIADYELDFKNKGYSVFLYKTFANATAELNERIISYSKESLCFIVIHELTHNYFIQQNISLPYEINEAVCDVLGNYLTLKYIGNSKQDTAEKTKKMVERNETTYEIINKYILEINTEKEETEKLCDQCNHEIYRLSKKYDDFQKDRFYHDVNTAYLLKNSYYSKYYFLIKQLYLKYKSTQQFIKIISAAPEDIDDCEKYIKEKLH